MSHPSWSTSPLHPPLQQWSAAAVTAPLDSSPSTGHTDWLPGNSSERSLCVRVRTCARVCARVGVCWHVCVYLRVLIIKNKHVSLLVAEANKVLHANASTGVYTLTACIKGLFRLFPADVHLHSPPVRRIKSHFILMTKRPRPAKLRLHQTVQCFIVTGLISA